MPVLPGETKAPPSLPASDVSVAPPPASESEAERRQAAYAASRRAWAEAVGRPYDDHPDQRPPPGELDAGADADE